MKARYLIDHPAAPKHPSYVAGQGTMLRAGGIIEHPDAYKLVRMGLAEAADAGCEAAVQRTPEQLAIARRNYPATAAGITPDDRQRFFAGELLGYRPDGSEIPGPNAVDDYDYELLEDPVL